MDIEANKIHNFITGSVFSISNKTFFIFSFLHFWVPGNHENHECPRVAAVKLIIQLLIEKLLLKPNVQVQMKFKSCTHLHNKQKCSFVYWNCIQSRLSFQPASNNLNILL